MEFNITAKVAVSLPMLGRWMIRATFIVIFSY